jgi:hypothetical protein
LRLFETQYLEYLDLRTKKLQRVEKKCMMRVLLMPSKRN